MAIFLGIAPTKGHASTHVVGAPIREAQGHERIEGRVNGQEQLCLVEAVNEPWGWVGQHTSFQDVKPCAAKEPGPSKRHPWLKPVQDIGTNGIGRRIRGGIGAPGAMMHQRHLPSQSILGGEHVGRLRKHFLHAVNVATVAAVVPTTERQTHSGTPSARLCPIHVHLSSGRIDQPENQPRMGSVDAFVGTAKRAIARVQDAQSQTDWAVVGHGDAETNKCIPVRAHGLHQGVGLLQVVHLRIVHHPRAE